MVFEAPAMSWIIIGKVLLKGIGIGIFTTILVYIPYHVEWVHAWNWYHKIGNLLNINAASVGCHIAHNVGRDLVDNIST